MNLNWMIYGAYGEMGTLIIEEALKRNHRPILAGRNATKVRLIAEKYGLEWRAFEINEIQAQLVGVSLVLNLAGPYSSTCEPFVKACLASRVHYLDIANELPSFQTLHRYDAQAKERGMALIPGVGFGVIPTDMLSGYLAHKLPKAVNLDVAMLPENASGSSGAARTTIEIISRGGWVRRNGSLLSSRLGSYIQKIPFPGSERTLISAPLGDLETAYWSTRIPNITTYIETSPQTAPFMGIIMPLLRQLVRIPTIRHRFEASNISEAVAASTDLKPSYVWARVTDNTGKQVQAWLQLGEGLAFTAAASLLAVEQTLEKQLSGALSPAMAFGIDFILTIPGVTRIDAL